LNQASSEDNAEPWLAADRLDTRRSDALALEVAAGARARLIDVEVMLREFWYDSIDHTPQIAAHINVAAQLAHRAAEALAPETLL